MTIEPTGARVGDGGVFVMRNMGNGHDCPALSDDPTALVTGMHSGHQALNLAVLAGAARIVLLGYDMKAGPKVGAWHRNNWHNDHKRHTPAGHYDLYRQSFKKVPPILQRLGVEVLNATPGSALDVFPKVSIESVLPDPQPAGIPA